MRTFCIHCAMVALVDHQEYRGSDETPEEHVARVHPQGVNPADRQALEQRATDILQQKQE